MATLNGVPFRKMLVPASKYSIKCPYPMVAKKVTFHNTDNEMPAENEINYMRNNGNMTSYHLATDEKETIQGLPFDRNGWHAGDGGNGYGNRNTIGWEICRNYDRKRKTTRLIQPLAGMYDKAEMNTIKSAPAVFKKLGIMATIETVKKHQDWSGKNCPSKILNEARWSAFQVAVILEYNRYVGKGPVASKPSTPPSTSNEAKLVKKENAYFLVTTPDGIKVRNKPSVSATHTGTLKKGDSINYKRVFEGGGYRWLEYTGNSGNTLYVPYRESGSGKEQWGTFHSERPGKAVAPAPKPSPTVYYSKKKDSKKYSAGVLKLQKDLISIHFYPEKNKANRGADGYYGNATEDAVRRFQSVYTPKEVDGVAGPKTLAALAKQVK